MDPSSLTIDQLLDTLERKVETVYRNPFSHSTDQTEWAQVNRHINRGIHILARIKNRQNAFNPIHQLPPENFHRIFEQLQRPRKRFGSTHYWDHKREGKIHTKWLVVTKVCHHWRAISFSFPSLWRDILVEPESDGRAMQSWFMERSAPISFQVSQHRCIETTPMTTNQSLTGLHDSLSSCSNRLESISLSFDQGSQHVVVKLLDLPLPSLVDLSLNCDGVGGPEDFTFLPQLFGGQASRVRRLCLGSLWCWPANMETFKNLIHLVSDVPTPMLQFLIMLKACPRLEILHLRHGCHRGGDVILPTHLSQLPSPCLKSLLLETSFGYSPQQLLQHLNLSPTTSIYTEFMFRDLNGLATLREFDAVRGTNFEHQVTILEIQLGTQETVCLYRNHLVLSVSRSLISTLTSLSGHLPVLKGIRFSITDPSWRRRNAQNLKKGEAESAYEQFLNETPTLQTIHFKAPGFEDEHSALTEAISRSSTLIEELRITHASSQAERVEKVVERDPFPSYRVILEPRVPAVDIFPLFPGLELTRFVDTNTWYL